MRDFNLVRTLLTFLFPFIVAAELYSAPLSFVPIELKQPDGAILHVFASGDEFYHWVHDKDNFTIVLDPVSRWYVYAILRKGKLVPSSFIVGQDNPKTCGLTQNINVFPLSSERTMFAKAEAASMVSTSSLSSGLSNLIVFIRFNGEQEFTSTLSSYEAQLNSPAGPSLKHYYSEVSYNQLDLTSYFYQRSGDAIVSYQDDQPRNYYLMYDSIGNPTGYKTGEKTAREQSLLRKALSAVAPLMPSTVNFDGNGDGKVDNVVFIISGTAAGWSDLLWPHMSKLSSSPAVQINGKTVSSYNLQLVGTIDVRVLCHEMGHSLGMPDLYRYTATGFSPCGSWDIMCGGSAHMSNYLKFKYVKWIASIPEITVDGTYWLRKSTDPSNNIFKIKSPRSIKEYFLLEFRQKNGLYENRLPGSGLIVYRINGRVGGNSSGPPDEVYVYRPYGTLLINGSPDAAYFSSESGRTSMSDSTNPSSFLSDGQAGGLYVTNIGSAAGDSIQFDVKILPEVPIKIVNDYTGSKAPFAWVDISRTGTPITNWMNATSTSDAVLDDGYSASALPLGVDFTFYDQKYSSIFVGINGLVSFTQQALNIGSGGRSSLSEFGYFDDNIIWPGNAQFPNSIAVAYNDFDLNKKDGYGGGSILYQTIGNQFVLSWINVGTFEQTGDTTNTFQLILDGSNNTVTINFLSLGLDATRNAVRVGMQKDQTNGFCWLEKADDADRVPTNGSSVILSPSVKTSAGESPIVPARFVLEQNFPNPFNPETIIRYRLSEESLVNVTVYDMLGRTVAKLVNEQQPAGAHAVRFTSRTSGIPSSVYFYRLESVDAAGRRIDVTRKCVLLK